MERGQIKDLSTVDYLDSWGHWIIPSSPIPTSPWSLTLVPPIKSHLFSFLMTANLFLVSKITQIMSLLSPQILSFPLPLPTIIANMSPNYLPSSTCPTNNLKTTKTNTVTYAFIPLTFPSLTLLTSSTLHLSSLLLCDLNLTKLNPGF